MAAPKKGDIVACDGHGIQKASQLVKGGGVVIFPTDTVYGIGCDPYNASAINRVYEIKSRDASNPLPILVDSIDTAQSISAMNDTSIRMAEKFWPGPLTMVLSITDNKLAESMRLHKHSGIALRVPDHKCTQKLLDCCKMIAGTSANVSGAESTGDPNTCAKSMEGYDMILDGGVITNPTESTIVDARDGKHIAMLRKGKMTSLQEILQKL